MPHQLNNDTITPALNIYRVPSQLTAVNALSEKEAILAFCRHNTEKVIIDMTQVTETDIAGINVLVQAWMAASDNGISLELRIRRRSEAHKILLITKLEKWFKPVLI
ncbi:MAG: STAS domain-containing protein [Pseudobacter sp.]|uniref:STAS domain-containing protein n=1 Tax=Pseudobacter sp. TaxID=2045420 RepID=UPI003F81F3D8